MGLLSIVLTSMLPADDKLSVINQLSIYYSWFNLGGKMLKAAGLPRLWAAEKDMLRKLDKLPAAEAAILAAPLGGAANDSANPPVLVPDNAWYSLRRWAQSTFSRKHARQVDAELELVNAFVRQSKSPRATRTLSRAGPEAAILTDAPKPVSQPLANPSSEDPSSSTWASPSL